jgi:hypothetical protein
MLRRFSVLLLACLGCAALAQETSMHRLRVLAVGDPPPFVQEVRDGARYEVAPSADAIPPRVVTVPVQTKPGDSAGSTAMPLRLRLGQTSAPLLLPLPKDLRIELKSEQGAKWLGVPLQSCGASLALVWRGSRSWSEARTIVVPDDTEARMEGNVHFANLTASPMAVIIGSEKIRLDPGRTFTRHLSPGSAALPLEISYPSPSGGLRLCHSASLEATPGCFRRVVIYAADGKKPRSPVKVLQIEEPS